ncbi:MAG: DUF4416 family protein [Fibrobacter sp.]|nr:DUF4416 family protein [Fibrobacter sp.]
MGTPHYPTPATLIIGLLLRSSKQYENIKSELIQHYGALKSELPPFEFKWTSYYQKELGAKPWRAFLAFENLVERTTIAETKLFTNKIEEEWSDEQGRTVNLDPGLITLGQLFLASTKDQRQRVYLKKGIYLEPTLYFQNGEFHPFEWTYRDYQSVEYRKYFKKARNDLAEQLKERKLT